jgi:hypothetical protein
MTDAVDELAKAADEVAIAASDYALGCRDDEFSTLNGGLHKLRAILFLKVAKWEAAHPEGDCRSIV